MAAAPIPGAARSQPYAMSPTPSRSLATAGNEARWRRRRGRRTDRARSIPSTDRGPTDEAEPLHGARPGRAVGGASRLAVVADEQHRHRRCELADSSHTVGPGCADAVEEPAGDRPDDGGGHERAGPEHDDLGEHRPVSQVRHDRSASGCDHGIGGTEERRDGEQPDHSGGTARAEHDECHCRESTPRHEQRRDSAPIEAVRHPAAHEDEQQCRQELREADETDVERVSRDVEDLLEQDGNQQVLADRCEGRRCEVEPDRRDAEHLSGSRRHRVRLCRCAALPTAGFTRSSPSIRTLGAARPARPTTPVSGRPLWYARPLEPTPPPTRASSQRGEGPGYWRPKRLGGGS